MRLRTASYIARADRTIAMQIAVSECVRGARMHARRVYANSLRPKTNNIDHGQPPMQSGSLSFYSLRKNLASRPLLDCMGGWP
jgi:hypothetical protein